MQGSHRLEKYLDIQVCLEKSLKICLKKYLKKLKGLEKSLNFTIAGGFNSVFGGLNQYKIVVPYLVQHMLHQIKTPQFYTNYLKLVSLVMNSSISEVEF